MNEKKTGTNVPEQPTIPRMPRMIPSPPRPAQPQVVINAQNCAFNIWQNTGEEERKHETEDRDV